VPCVPAARTVWLLAAVLSAAPVAASSGVVVDLVRPGTSAAAAGMEPGDRILSLDGEPVADILAWHEVRWERAPRGGARLAGLRGEAPRSWTIEPGPWGIEVLALDGSDALGARYLAALEALRAGDSEGAAAAASEIAGDLEAAGQARTAAAVRLDFARRLGAVRALAAADRIAVEAVARLDAAGLRLEAAFARLELGMRRQLREDWTAAATPLGEAETAFRALAPRSLRLGRVVYMLGFSAARLGDFAAATPRYAEAERLYRELAPESLELADIYTSQAILATIEERFDDAFERYSKALALQLRLDREGRRVATTQATIGGLYTSVGRFAEAEASYGSGLALARRFEPEGLLTATLLHNLGLVATKRGDLARADELLRESLAISERLDPGGDRIARACQDLAWVALGRGDAESAARWAARVDANLFADPHDLWAVENLLGAVAERQGRLDAAAGFYRAAAAIAERAFPGTLLHAAPLHDLGRIEKASGDLTAAEAGYRAALAIRREQVPGGIDEALSRQALGELALDRRDPVAAEAELARAVAIHARVAPGTEPHATSLHALARAVAAQGRTAEAGELYCRAADALDAQRDRLGGEELARARFAERYSEIYRACAEARLESEGAESALALAERFRARVFREILEQRELDRRELGAPPALAAPDLGAARAALPARTLALVYWLGDPESWVFVVRRDRAVRLVRLPAAAAELAGAVGRLRAALAARDAAARGRFDREARALYAELVAPVEAELPASEELLVVADGALHQLPFAALRDLEGRYLIERLPVHFALSLAVHAELRARPPAPPGAARLAFGSPAGAERPVDSGRRQRRLEALPESAREANAVARHWGAGARALLGADATETRVKASLSSSALAHFAVHALVDDHRPLDSALVLALPDPDEDGMLRAWEVVESLDLPGATVVLSACETALGAEVEGEGLMGLTRAFHLAGARTVVATLWSVGDRSSADLMERFHAHLAAGQPPAGALRAAQLEILRGIAADAGAGAPGAARGVGGLAPAREAADASPANWAGFLVSGASD
jgi:CHAT domain-containing protein